MRLSQAIDWADQIRPNTILKEEKIPVLLKLETEIAEMMDVDPPQWGNPADDPELLIPDTHAIVYPYMLLPFIDHYQEETDLYQIDMITANQTLAETKAWWRRHHRQSEDVHFKGVFF